MNWDEYEYYFELKELEPFAGVPLADLFLNVASRDAGQGPRTGNAAPIGPAQAAAVASPTPDRGDHSPPAIASSRNARSATPAVHDSHSPNQVAIGGSSDSTSKCERIDELSRPDPGLPENAAGAPRGSSGSTMSPRMYGSWQGGFEHWQDRISVHVLGQFAFCNRAGIYSAENGDETDLDEPSPNWVYLPNFDLERIEEQLASLLRQSLLLLVVNSVFVLAIAAGVWFHDRRLIYPALIGLFFAFISLQTTVGGVLTLLWRRAAARRARVDEPATALDRIQPANWWSLLKAGFDAIPYQRQFRHPELPLEGSPWRVLERGSLRIPVIKSGADKLGDAKHKIYPKHELRLAAYAMLLEATEHTEVPYGLIFPADSHLGLAVPITPSMRAQVVEWLERASDLLMRSQQGDSEPRPPAERNRCASCRLGEPLEISDAEIASLRKSRTQLVVLADETRTWNYHCACADRFGSAPPHRRIIELGLSARVE